MYISLLNQMQEESVNLPIVDTNDFFALTTMVESEIYVKKRDVQRHI